MTARALVILALAACAAPRPATDSTAAADTGAVVAPAPAAPDTTRTDSVVATPAVDTAKAAPTPGPRTPRAPTSGSTPPVYGRDSVIPIVPRELPPAPEPRDTTRRPPPD